MSILGEFLYGARRVAETRGRGHIICPACGIRADFEELIEEQGIITCQRCKLAGGGA